MLRWAVSILVFAAFVAEAGWSAWGGAEQPWQRLTDPGAAGAVAGQAPQFDPFVIASYQTAASDPHGWNADNPTLEAILGSAIWRASAECAADTSCTRGAAKALRPL